MKRLLSFMLAGLLAILVVFGITDSTALAHERRAVAKYQVVVGWIVEPALEGQKNGVDLRVTSNVTGETKPVLGLEKTLKVEITYIPTSISKTFDLRTIFNDPGHYTTDLILNESGVYRMRFFGNIEDTTINETFNSKGGGGGYGDVEPVADIQFPQQLPSIREITSATKGAQDAASSAKTMSVVATIIAAGGVAVGAGSWIIKRR